MILRLLILAGAVATAVEVQRAAGAKAPDAAEASYAQAGEQGIGRRILACGEEVEESGSLGKEGGTGDGEWEDGKQSAGNEQGTAW